MPDMSLHISLTQAVEAVKALSRQKAGSGSRAEAAGRWNVADRRFEEARVLREEVVPRLERLPTLPVVVLDDDRPARPVRTLIVPDDARIVRVSEIRARRAAEGLTMRQLAAEYSVSAAYVSRVLAGHRAGTTDRRRRVVEAADA